MSGRLTPGSLFFLFLTVDTPLTSVVLLRCCCVTVYSLVQVSSGGLFCYSWRPCEKFPEGIWGATLRTTELGFWMAWFLLKGTKNQPKAGWGEMGGCLRRGVRASGSPQVRTGKSGSFSMLHHPRGYVSNFLVRSASS